MSLYDQKTSMQITHDLWAKFFPFKEPRNEQIDAINFALNAYLNDKKKFVVLELGTGVGKSAIGVAIARFLNSLDRVNGDAYILTTQKLLQDQYMTDFGVGIDPLVSIKSSSNYTCGYYKEQSCGESRRLLTTLKKHFSDTAFASSCSSKKCVYAVEKSNFMNASLGITNYSYFLAETMYAKKLTPRGLLIIDEAHNTEAELAKFISIVFSTKFANDVLNVKRPNQDDDDIIFKWVKQKYKPALTKHIKTLLSTIESMNENSDMDKFSELSKKYESLDKHICKVNRFIDGYDKKNWIMNVSAYESGKNNKKYEFKPIDLSNDSDETLFKFGERVLMLSATIVDNDVFCRSLGIKKQDVAYMRAASPFDVENKPIHYMPVGSMSKNNIEQTLPIMTEAIKMLLEQHADDKGIIHCVSFKVANHIVQNLRSNRLLIHDSINREEILKLHLSSKEPTVLISPSMSEGVNLADDASRFQIICKVPFPYLGDVMVKKKMERDSKWYVYMTAKTVIQSLGRSIRSENDHAISYILDSDWDLFFTKNSSMFPEDFVASIKK